MNDLPLEILTEIAKKDLTVWRMLAKNLSLFNTFAKSEYGQNVLIDLFVKRTQECCRISLKVSDASLTIWDDGDQWWYQNGLRYRTLNQNSTYHREGAAAAINRTVPNLGG